MNEEGSERNIVEGDEEVRGKENFERNAQESDDAMYGHGIRGTNSNIVGNIVLNGEELNVIL
jgi:hypothetical protein